MSDKKELLKKIKALAERGIEGEAMSAQNILDKMMKKYGISEQELNEQIINRYEFRYSKPFEKQLLSQIIYMVMGDVPIYYYTNSKKKVRLIDCTAGEKIEIETAFNFYRHYLAEGLLSYYYAFITSEELFPPESKQANLPHRKVTEEESRLRGVLKKHTMYKAITDTHTTTNTL